MFLNPVSAGPGMRGQEVEIRKPKMLRSKLSILALLLVSKSHASDPFRPSANEQIHLGQQVAAEIRRTMHVLPSTDVRVTTLRRIGRRILSTFPASEQWQFSFDVV